MGRELSFNYIQLSVKRNNNCNCQLCSVLFVYIYHKHDYICQKNSLVVDVLQMKSLIFIPTDEFFDKCTLPLALLFSKAL